VGSLEGVGVGGGGRVGAKHRNFFFSSEEGVEGRKEGTGISSSSRELFVCLFICLFFT